MNIRTQVLVGLVAGALLIVPTAYLDALFFPIVLAGPPIAGAVAASRGIALAPVLALWVGFGLTMLVFDWVVNQEDQVFHIVLTAIMSLLAVAGHAAVRALLRRRERTPAGDAVAGK